MYKLGIIIVLLYYRFHSFFIFGNNKSIIDKDRLVFIHEPPPVLFSAATSQFKTSNGNLNGKSFSNMHTSMKSCIFNFSTSASEMLKSFQSDCLSKFSFHLEIL